MGGRILNIEMGRLMISSICSVDLAKREIFATSMSDMLSGTISGNVDRQQREIGKFLGRCIRILN